jgi:hypothetical protein
VRWVCRECGCLYTPGAPCCPDCRATAHDEEAAPAAGDDSGEEDEVPKIDRFSVATIGSVTTGHASAILPDSAAVPPAAPPAGVSPAAEEAPATVTVAEQKAAGVPAEETVTVAEQKAGAEPPVPPKAPASPTPPARSAPPKRAGNG